MENTNALNPFLLSSLNCFLQGSIMHNLISYNQLAGSNVDPHNDLITEYYECLIECDEDQHICKRICKEVLVY